MPETDHPYIRPVAADLHVDPGRIAPEPTWAHHDGISTIHRLDNRPPVDENGDVPDESPFKQGFRPRPETNPSGNLHNYQNANHPSMFVGATTNENLGTGGRWKDSWRYQIRPPKGNSGINVNDTLPKKDNQKQSENEIAFPGGIHRQYIVGAQKLTDGKAGGLYHDNPYFGKSDN